MNKKLFRTSAGSISSFSTVVGITLVLTLLGVLFIFLLITDAVESHFRKQLTIQVMLKDAATEDNVMHLKKLIEGEDYSGDVFFTSKEEAAAIMQEELGGEEFIDFLGYNPLPASIDIHINPAFGELDSLDIYVDQLEKNELVHEVVLQKGLLREVKENMAKWGLGLLIIGVLLLVIAVALIVITIELAIFSQRFIIRSMQLVGATHWFIQKPFLMRGLWYGFISALFAMAIISGLLYFFRTELIDVIEILTDQNRFLILCGAVMLTGLCVSWLATAYAVRRFVRLKQESFY